MIGSRTSIITIFRFDNSDFLLDDAESEFFCRNIMPLVMDPISMASGVADGFQSSSHA